MEETNTDQKQNSALKIVTYLGSVSNVHGISRIATSGSTTLRIFWTSLLISSLIATTIHLAVLVKTYHSYSVIEITSTVEGVSVEFPAVTLCNSAPTSNQKVTDLLSNGPDLLPWLMFLDTVDFGSHKSTLDSIQSFYSNLPIAARQISHTIGSFVIHCRFGNQDCGYQNFSLAFDSKDYYNCYTFNAGRDRGKLNINTENLLMHNAGLDNGLSLILSLGTENHHPGTYGLYDMKKNLAFSLGARVQVHAAGTMPSPFNHGFDVPPGYSTSVALKASLRSRLDHPHGNCTNNKLNVDGQREYRYTMFICLQICKQQTLRNKCGCKNSALYMLPEVEPMEQQVPFCSTIKGWKNWNLRNKNTQNLSKAVEENIQLSMKRMSCEETVLHSFNTDRSYEYSCGCVQPCKEISYQKSLSMSYWPQEFYQFHALNEFYKDPMDTTDLIKEAFVKLNSTIHRFGKMFAQGKDPEYNITDLNDITRASTLIRQNFIRLNIYLEDLSLIDHKKIPAYGISDLLADIGGILGLWLGISVLTVMELVELIMSLTLFLFKSRSKLRSTETYHE